MNKSKAFKTQPWISIQREQQEVFSQNFIQKNQLLVKVLHQSPFSSVEIKQIGMRQDGKIALNDQIKCWLTFRNNKSLYTRINKNDFKLHYDHNSIYYKNHLLNFYCSLKGSNIIGRNVIYKAGFQVQRSFLSSNFRIRSDYDSNSITLYNKTHVTKEGWNFSTVNAVNLSKFCWNLSIFQFGWQWDENSQCFVRFNGGKKYEKVYAKNYLKGIIFDAIYKSSENTTIGVEVEANLSQKSITNTTLVLNHQYGESQEQKIKVKGDLNGNLSLSIGNKLVSYGYYVLGVNVHNLGKTNKLSYGVQLSLDI